MEYYIMNFMNIIYFMNIMESCGILMEFLWYFPEFEWYFDGIVVVF